MEFRSEFAIVSCTGDLLSSKQGPVRRSPGPCLRYRLVTAPRDRQGQSSCPSCGTRTPPVAPSIHIQRGSSRSLAVVEPDLMMAAVRAYLPPSGVARLDGRYRQERCNTAGLASVQSERTYQGYRLERQHRSTSSRSTAVLSLRAECARFRQYWVGGATLNVLCRA